MIETEVLKALSQNIMGTPAMSFKKVVHDLKQARATGASVICFQEMKWPWYWVAVSRVFPKSDWGRHPGRFLSRGNAQLIIWDKRIWKKVDAVTMLLHAKVPGHSEARYINAVLLEHRKTGLRQWFKNTHYVPDGFNKDGDDKTVRPIWENANKFDKQFTRHLSTTGDPIYNVGDYNRLHFDVLGEVINRHHVTYVGKRGLDYTVLIPGDKAHVSVVESSVVPHARLYTDHEGRLLTYRLKGHQ